MSTIARRWTYDDLLETPDDGQRYELIGGDLIVTPAPLPEHQELSVELVATFRAFVKPRGLGRIYAAPIDVRLSNEDVVQPDIVFVSAERRAIVSRRAIEGAPDLVIEILSPSTRDTDLDTKAALYARFGVREYWIVDPTVRSITVLALRDGRYAPVPHAGSVVRSLVLPGLKIDVPTLFADLW